MARYIYKSTRNYNIGFDWVITSFDLDYVHFRFVVPSIRGFNISCWMTAQQAYNYTRFGGLLYDFSGSIKIIKRITIIE